MKKVFLALYFWFIVILFSFRAGYHLSLVKLKSILGISKLSVEDGAHEAGIRWAHGIFFAMRHWWKIDVAGKEHILPSDEPAVIVCNHQSMADIWALYFINKPFRWIAKAALFKIPIIGWGMKMAGYIPIVRHNRNSRAEALEQSRDCLAQGASMLFFPEGTRSKDGQLLPFKTGAFKLAAEMGVPLQPVVIDGAQKLLEKHTIWPGKATVFVRIMVPMTCHPGETPVQLCERTRQIMISTLKELRSS